MGGPGRGMMPGEKPKDFKNSIEKLVRYLGTLSSESPSLTREESTRLFYEVEKDYLDIRSKLKRFKEIRENPHFNALQVKFAYPW